MKVLKTCYLYWVMLKKGLKYVDDAYSLLYQYLIQIMDSDYINFEKKCINMFSKTFLFLMGNLFKYLWNDNYNGLPYPRKMDYV